LESFVKQIKPPKAMSTSKVNLAHEFYTNAQMQELWTVLLEKEGVCIGLIDDLGAQIRDYGNLHSSQDEEAIIERERLNGALGRQRKFLQNIQQAKDRHRSGTIGTCVDTKVFIPFERLKLAPTTTRCIEAKLENGKPRLGVAA
jgi:RNA polymerase-binding transcription factor DksA